MELDEYLPVAAAGERPVRRGRGRRRCWRTAGRRGCPAARTGGWPTWCGTWPRCSTSGGGWCAPAPGPVGLRRAAAAPGRRAARLRSRPQQRGAGDGAGRRRTRPSRCGPGRRSRTSPSCCAGSSRRRWCTPSTSSRCWATSARSRADVGLDGLDEWLEVMVPGGAARGSAGRARTRWSSTPSDAAPSAPSSRAAGRCRWPP